MHQLQGELPKLAGAYEKEILVGATEDEIVTVQISIGDECNSSENQHLSLSGTTYGRRLISEEEGQQMARGYLEGGFLWRDAVQAERTTLGLDEWTEEVLSTDGWEAIIGDIHCVGNGMYTQENGGGQIDGSITPDSFQELAVLKSDVERMWGIWHEHHLKPLTEVPMAVRIEVRELFDKYPAFEVAQLLRFGLHD